MSGLGRCRTGRLEALAGGSIRMRELLDSVATVVNLSHSNISWDDEEECIKIAFADCQHVVALFVRGFGVRYDTVDMPVQGAVCFVSAEESSRDEKLKTLLAGCEKVNQNARKDDATLRQLLTIIGEMSSEGRAPTRQEMAHGVRKLCRDAPEVVDVLLSAFSAALRSSRVATALLPFPAPFKRSPSVTSPGDSPRLQARDFEAVRAAMEPVRAVREMAHRPGLIEGYDDATLDLLWWILCAAPGPKFSVNASKQPGAVTSHADRVLSLIHI